VRSKRARWLGWLIAVACGVAQGAACSRSIEVATVGEQPRAGDADAGCNLTECDGVVLECGDCEDNDADGLSDAEDPDCWGACHDSEANWAPRQQCSNGSCFFDRNCGLGNDEDCVSLAPNGCDCHGCCELRGSNTSIFLGTLDDLQNPTCGAESSGDPTSCAVCEVDELCFNACEVGEVCF
jgi:hypothetical protein